MKANTATANIVAEMRDRAKRPDFIAPGVLREYADRIDAAWKREIAEVEASALDVGGVVEASRHTGKENPMHVNGGRDECFATWSQMSYGDGGAEH